MYQQSSKNMFYNTRTISAANLSKSHKLPYNDSKFQEVILKKSLYKKGFYVHLMFT